MSSNNKGLVRDVRPGKQPAGTYPYGKNGIQHDILDVIQNEPGFRISSAQIPYKTLGIIETSKNPVIINGDGTNTAIGYFDEANDTYVPIFNDTNLAYKLGLRGDKYVVGQSQSNYKRETVIAFTNNDTFPMYLNCDNPSVNSLDDFRLFPLASAPIISLTQDGGGSNKAGAYFISVKYTKNDGTETNFLGLSDVEIVRGNIDGTSDRSILVQLTGCDTKYDNVIIAVVSKVNGITSAVQLDPIPIGSNGSVFTIYTGTNVSTDITVDEILTPPVSYKKVGTMGQLNDALYIAMLEREAEIVMQKHALLVKLQWVSSLESVNPVSNEILNGRKRGFPHEEVISAYIQYAKTDGGYTKAFHIPGVVPTADSLTNSALASAQGITAKKYQVEDTITVFDSINKTGSCGVWVNDNELYPDTPDYDASAIGGENLRNQKVRHNRMPSIAWCKQNLYPFEASYGKTALDVLGIKASNIIIPAEFSTLLTGYRILFAKRSIGNSTVLGQSLLMHPGRQGSPITNTINTPDTNYISTGGNWNSLVRYGNVNDRTPIILDKKLFRFHSFDMLFNKPQVTPTYVSMQLRHQVDNINNTLLEDFSIEPGEKNGPVVFLCDYITNGNTPQLPVSGKRLRAVSETQYVPNNLVSGKWKNTQQETAFGGKLSNDLLDSGDISYHQEYIGNNRANQDPAIAANKEVCYLANLMALKSDVYLPMSAQPLVIAGTKHNFDEAVFYGGDTFVNDYCFHTYGWPDALNRGHGGDIGGTKVVRRFVCEAASNINARYQITGNDYSKWYPAFPLVPQSPTNYITLHNRNFDPNQFGYNKDLNALNDLTTATIFNPSVENPTEFPHRIHRLGKLSRQTKSRSWRTCLPLDYYECQKNMGIIIHIEGMDDHLIIHHENAMFITRDKTKLESDLLSITLGAGDIFQFEPQEPLSSKLGYAGTQHNLACVRTPAGYVAIDGKQGQIFMYKGGLQIMNEGLNTFFREFLKLKETNTFIGNGFTIGYDPVYKRILLTVKNKKGATTGKIYYNYENTSEFISQLVVGDLVYQEGRWTRFLGVNSSPWSCEADIVPHVDDAKTNVNENAAANTLVSTLTAQNVANMFIISGNVGNAFKLHPTTFELTVNNSAALDYETLMEFRLVVRGYASDGVTYDDALIVVGVTNLNEKPITGDVKLQVNENAANSTVVGTVGATDPDGDTLTFAIVTAGVVIFAINSSTGVITVADNTTLDYETAQLHEFDVSVSDGTNSVLSHVTIRVQDVDEAPEFADTAINILDTLPSGKVVYQFAATDGETGPPDSTEEPPAPLVYELVNCSVPGAFTVLTDGTVKLNTALNATLVNQYILTVLVRDGAGNTTIAQLTVNIKYDPSTIEFSPAGASCSTTTKQWSLISIYSTYLSAVITTVPNSAGSFQGITLPVYADIANHVDCGGAVQHYLNDMQSVGAVKNDCAEGVGSVETYYVQKGRYISTTSLAAANALAIADRDANAQAYANANGSCTI